MMGRQETACANEGLAQMRHADLMLGLPGRGCRTFSTVTRHRPGCCCEVGGITVVAVWRPDLRAAENARQGRRTWILEEGRAPREGIRRRNGKQEKLGVVKLGRNGKIGKTWEERWKTRHEVQSKTDERQRVPNNK